VEAVTKFYGQRDILALALAAVSRLAGVFSDPLLLSLQPFPTFTRGAMKEEVVSPVVELEWRSSLSNLP
jgi:hypothetical protein